ncbi:MAG TPA: alanine racemase, partial [Dehalococcoidales bacterium]|nr:alanine racemase [Dehalococcoidales bacterium]
MNDRWVEIDLSALTQNINSLRQHLQPGVQLMGVVKKNAYGHGAVPVTKAAVAAGAEWLGVYSLEEGSELRDAGIAIPILILGNVPHAQAATLVEKKLTPTVVEAELPLTLNRVAQDLDTTIAVHIKVDTGLNRSGANVGDIADLLHFISGLRRIKVGGLYTHFASADELDRRTTETQLQRFLEVATNLPEPRLLHAANSAATLMFPETHLDMVRVGIAMYGVYPSPAVGRTIPLQPVLSLKSRVVRLHWIRAGEGVSYGLTWKAKKDTSVALVSFGYGDGLPRLLSNCGQVLVHGQRAPIRGRVCMDQCIVDVTDVPEVKVGDE